ncbi:MAG: hypothetical protein FJW63_09775 [Actinobacteria bacterium]|nr:hypothetical protein [Actinomycetota bacterium]
MKAKKIRYLIHLLIFTIIITFCSFSCSPPGPGNQTIEEPALEEVTGEPEEALDESEEEEIVEEDEEETLVEEDDNESNAEINYEIVRTLNVRVDGAITYYALIDPIDLSNDSFKEDIKEIIKKIVEEKGRKIDIEIFDNRSSLENGYKDDKFFVMTDLEGWENWITDEIAIDLAIHWIASVMST